MPTCDPQQLITDAGCFECLPAGQQELAKLALLVQILQVLDPAYVLNVQQLITDAGCFQCLSPGELALAKLALLCRISEA